MTGAIWSTPAYKAALDFPALTLVRFFHNHHLLQITGKPKWMTVKGGSYVYFRLEVGWDVLPYCKRRWGRIDARGSESGA